MYTHWTYLFPFGNVVASFIVATYYSNKRHLEFGYIFFFSIGFSFIIGWIIAAMATPKDKELRKSKADIYTYILAAFFLIGFFFEGKQAYAAFADSGKLHNSSGDMIELYSYEKANNTKVLWQSTFLAIGCLTGAIYMGKGDKSEPPKLDSEANENADN